MGDRHISGLDLLAFFVSLHFPLTLISSTSESVSVLVDRAVLAKRDVRADNDLVSFLGNVAELESQESPLLLVVVSCLLFTGDLVLSLLILSFFIVDSLSVSEDSDSIED